MVEHIELRRALPRWHSREAVGDVSRSKGRYGQTVIETGSGKPGRTDGALSARMRIGPRSAHLHTGPRRVNGRTMRPDTRQHLTTCQAYQKIPLALAGATRRCTRVRPTPSSAGCSCRQRALHRDGYRPRAPKPYLHSILASPKNHH